MSEQGACEQGTNDVLVLGDYWRDATDESSDPVRTPLGHLIHQAKDLGDESAKAELAGRFARIAEQLAPLSGHSQRLVVAVPPRPKTSDSAESPLSQNQAPPPTAAQAEPLSTLLAAALAAAGAGVHTPDAVTRTNQTPRMRDAAPSSRAALATAAGYQAQAKVKGQEVVLVDDVVLTGATLQAVSKSLRAAGAKTVIQTAAAKTRLCRL